MRGVYFTPPATVTDFENAIGETSFRFCLLMQSKGHCVLVSFYSKQFIALEVGNYLEYCDTVTLLLQLYKRESLKREG